MVTMITIAVDTLGGDLGPQAIVEGVCNALGQSPQLRVILVGEKQPLSSLVDSQEECFQQRLEVINAFASLSLNHSVKSSLQQKEGSIAIATRLVKEGKAEALVSAGNTAFVVAHTVLEWRLLEGVGRPGIATLLPTFKDPVVLIDVGASVDCRPEHLLQFGYLGSSYVRHILGKENPTVALLNIGEEKGKGNKLTRQAFSLLKESELNFVGNAEGSDLLSGEFDVVVCDGFTGNVLLKFGEAASHMFVRLWQQELSRKGVSDKAELKDFQRKTDFREYGGAPLLGVQGNCVICHGISDALAIKNAIQLAIRLVESSLLTHLRSTIRTVQASSKGESL